MTGSPEYAFEKTLTAVEVMASGAAPLRERVADAFHYHLNMLKIHTIPWDDLRERFEVLCSEVTEPGGSLVNVAPALDSLPDDEVSRIALGIVSLFVGIAERHLVERR